MAETSERPRGVVLNRYYEKYGAGHDWLLRCVECHKLVTLARLKKLGGCDTCGCRRVKEIHVLSEEEMGKIQTGAIDFPHRDEFLMEFKAITDEADSGVSDAH